MLPRTFLKLLLILAALLFFVDKAAACSCDGQRQRPEFHPVMVYWSNDAVFTGEVTEITFAQLDKDGKPVRFSDRVIHFSVDKGFRGVEGPGIEIITSALCGSVEGIELVISLTYRSQPYHEYHRSN